MKDIREYRRADFAALAQNDPTVYAIWRLWAINTHLVSFEQATIATCVVLAQQVEELKRMLADQISVQIGNEPSFNRR